MRRGIIIAGLVGASILSGGSAVAADAAVPAACAADKAAVVHAKATVAADTLAVKADRLLYRTAHALLKTDEVDGVVIGARLEKLVVRKLHHRLLAAEATRAAAKLTLHTDRATLKACKQSAKT